MTTKPVPVQLFELGYTDLISVVPPNAPLSPGSKLSPSQLGKTPGKRLENGTWVGFSGWVNHVATKADVEQWCQDGANIGLLGARFPALDIDSLDPWISAEVAALAQRVLGPAPVRTGRAPKQLLVYLKDEGELPFSRMAVVIKKDDATHLVEFLAAGRQYVVYGTHPSGAQYSGEFPKTDRLTRITKADVVRFFDTLKETFEVLPGVTVERIGDGSIRSETAKDQSTLAAPSIAELEAAVSMIPNNADTSREDYITTGYAIKAASQEDEEEGYRIFAEWAGKHSGSNRVEGNPDTWRSDWRKMRPPYSIGWSWLAELARRYGYNDAGNEFSVIDQIAEAKHAEEEGAPWLSDKWLAHHVIAEKGDIIRFVPAEGIWYVWNLGTWEPDAVSLADHIVSEVLEKIAAKVVRMGATEKEQREMLQQSRRLCSAYCRDSVRKLVECDPRIALKPESFDNDPWILNTVSGIVNLKTGEVTAHDPVRLCSKRTRVGPANADCPLWRTFLLETCGGDVQMVRYLQRVVGYCLTGITTEHSFWMVWGPGGNGKSVFLNTVMDLLGDYSRSAPMDTFTASQTEKHPAELAMLLGARLVSASETQAGKRWDEAKMKRLTGGDPVSARFMHKNFFTFSPQFKLIFVGNHRPELREVDPAMRRRVHLVPFVFRPVTEDPQLGAKLRAEGPAILNWAIQGCLDWQSEGLQPPPGVAAATEEYLNEQDAVQRWLEEVTQPAEGHYVDTAELYESWREWCGRNGEYVGTQRRLVQALVTKGMTRDRDPRSRRRGFIGVALIPQEVGVL